MTTLSAHQPAYLPWPGYLARIAAADVFVVLDTVQFERGSFTNRNRIKTQHGEHWLTVPLHLKGHMEKPIYEIKIDNTKAWRETHFKTIYHAYKKAPRSERLERLLPLFEGRESWLSPLCATGTQFWCDEFGITARKFAAPILKQKPKDGNDLLIRLCKEFGANEYLSGPLGRNYINEEAFAKEGITVKFQEWQCPTYPQPLFDQFLPNLSVLDMWLNTDMNPFLSLQPTRTTKLWERVEPSPGTLPKETLSILS